MNRLKWYALKVVSNREEKIKANLEVELAKANLQCAVGEVLIPYEKVYEVRAGKRQVKNRNLMPGYILLQADLSNDLLLQLLKNISGVLGFLGTRGWGGANPPVPMSQAEVDPFIGKEGSREVVDLKLSVVFSIGELVEIINGPFAGFSGKIQEVYEDKKTLNVIVKIFDERSTPIELSYTQVKKVL